jgi:hypothetical protein
VINSLMQEISWHWFTNQWDYSRTYYDGDGTENQLNEYSNESIERTGCDGDSTLCTTDVIFEG